MSATTIERFFQVGLVLPSTSQIGRMFFLIGTPNKLYICKVANSWVEIGSFSPAGLFLVTTTVPADGSLSAGDCTLYYDSTNGAARLLVKAKSADGTVVTAEVPLS